MISEGILYLHLVGMLIVVMIRADNYDFSCGTSSLVDQYGHPKIASIEVCSFDGIYGQVGKDQKTCPTQSLDA